jgi:hypothetical protein
LRIFLTVLAVCLMIGCATPDRSSREQEAFERYQKTGELPKDPLLESTEWYRRQDCLKRCAEGELCSEKCK